MNVLIVADPYPPEIRSISLMIRELAEDLTARGHRVTVATCWPRYNLSAEARNQEFEELTTENDVRVVRVKTLPNHKVNFIVRGIAELTLPYFFMRKIRRHVREKVDAVIVYTSPLPLARVGAWVKKRDGARFLLNIQDIFPQNAVDLGILKNKRIIEFFERMEADAYGEADFLTSHTSTGRKFLIERKGVPEGKITVIPNWIDVDAFGRAKATGEFLREYGLEGRFVFLFAGIIGPAQDIDFMLEVASEVVDLKEISFLFVGDGTEAGRLRQKAAERGLANVQFRPFVSQDRYPALVREADVGLVCLSPKNRTSAIPGKVQGFMAAGVPVAAFVNEVNDTHALLKEAGCGFSMVPDNVGEAAGLVRDIFSRRGDLAGYGQKGRDYARAHFSKGVCIGTIDKIIRGEKV